MILSLYVKYGKITIVAHSLGNCLVDVYMRMYDDYDMYIKNYFAAAPPFNGTSYVVPLCFIKGYDMNLPLPKAFCK